MHELSIAQALIEQVQRELKRCGQSGRIRRLELSVGRLSGVSCDSLRFAFELIRGDTPVAEAELQISQPKATCRCRACDAEAEIDEVTVQCPACGSTQIVVEGGRELLLESIEIED
jgi:hydrogenase nickel incorporation protein HypA/HybF